MCVSVPGAVCRLQAKGAKACPTAPALIPVDAEMPVTRALSGTPGYGRSGVCGGAVRSFT